MHGVLALLTFAIWGWEHLERVRMQPLQSMQSGDTPRERHKLLWKDRELTFK